MTLHLALWLALTACPFVGWWLERRLARRDGDEEDQDATRPADPEAGGLEYSGGISA